MTADQTTEKLGGAGQVVRQKAIRGRWPCTRGYDGQARVQVPEQPCTMGAFLHGFPYNQDIFRRLCLFCTRRVAIEDGDITASQPSLLKVHPIKLASRMNVGGRRSDSTVGSWA
jgi:hypothetical protein